MSWEYKKARCMLSFVRVVFSQYKGSNGTNNEIILHNDKWAQLKSNELVIMNPAATEAAVGILVHHTQRK